MSSCITGTLMCKFGGVHVVDIISTFHHKFGLFFEEIFSDKKGDEERAECQLLGNLVIVQEDFRAMISDWEDYESLFVDWEDPESHIIEKTMIVPITVRWENGARASGKISFLVLEAHEKILRTIFSRKNLQASEQERWEYDSFKQNDIRQRLFVCSLDAFLDWSKKAIEWNRKTDS